MHVKKCRWCWTDKPLEEFRNKKSRTGKEFGDLCADCKRRKNQASRKSYTPERYQADVEKRRRLLAQSVPKGEKRCRTCLNVKPNDQFVIAPNKTTRVKGGPSNYCEECRTKRREHMQRRRTEWTEEQREKERALQRRIAAGIKKRVLEHYGNRCSCCGETESDFLTLDHIHRDGALERKGGINGSRFYRYVIRTGFSDRYRCLCWNCNWAIGAYGECPHERARKLHPVDQLIRTTPKGGEVR